MSRLKVKINCEDCSAERMITKACLKLVSRCKPCQKIFNRDRARNAYRAKKGIPLDKPITSIIKKKEKVAVTVATSSSSEESVSYDAWGKPIKTAETKIKKAEPTVSPEEQARRKASLQKLFDMLPDDATDDDW